MLPDPIFARWHVRVWEQDYTLSTSLNFFRHFFVAISVLCSDMLFFMPLYLCRYIFYVPINLVACVAIFMSLIFRHYEYFDRIGKTPSSAHEQRERETERELESRASTGRSAKIERGVELWQTPTHPPQATWLLACAHALSRVATTMRHHHQKSATSSDIKVGT